MHDGNHIAIREPWSAFTHFVGMVLAALAAFPLLHKAVGSGSRAAVVAMAIFMASMVLLYGASALYHSVVASERVLKVFKKVDHMMIFVLIAGSYTPICMIVLGGKSGYALLAAVWGLALAGIVVNALWINCPRWFSSVIYIAVGWVCVFVFRELLATLPPMGFFWLFAGGVIYTIGGIIYALKIPLFNNLHEGFGNHEIFHLFVMAGSVCHFIFMYCYAL